MASSIDDGDHATKRIRKSRSTNTSTNNNTSKNRLSYVVIGGGIAGNTTIAITNIINANNNIRCMLCTRISKIT